MISEYAKGLERRVKKRYSQKFSVIGVDPATIPAEQVCRESSCSAFERMNDPLVNIWVISENDGTILSAHCFECKAALAESYSHIVLFYSEATTRIYGKQVKCSWILSTYVNEVPYARAKEIDFSSAKKLKEELDQKIEDVQQPQVPNHTAASSSGTTSTGASAPQRMQRASPPSKEETDQLYAKLNQCKI